MAWKLKKSKAAADDVPQGDDASSNVPASASQYDRPVNGTLPDSDYTDHNGSERTVMLLNDSDYIPGLIPSAPPMHDSHAATTDDSDLFPVTSDEDLDKYLRGEATFDPSVLGDEATDGASSHVQSAPVMDLDEPAHVGGRIDQIDAYDANAPIELEPLPVASAAVDADAAHFHDDVNLTHEDAVDSPHGALGGMDLDEMPSPAANADIAALHASPGEIDLDEMPSPAANVDIAALHASPGEIDLDEMLVAPEGSPPKPINGAAGVHRPIDALDDDSDRYTSAVNASDEAVASLHSATVDDQLQPASPDDSIPATSADAHRVGTSAMENWDLDAFAPYQPPGGAAATPLVAALENPSGGTVPADETLAGATSVSRLVVRLGQFSASYELIKGETTIGRPDPRTSVFPDVAVEWDDAVSRNHCRVLHKADGDYVEDTGSTNGSRLNDKPLSPYQPVVLSDGDRIGVGEKTEISYIK